MLCGCSESDVLQSYIDNYDEIEELDRESYISVIKDLIEPTLHRPDVFCLKKFYFDLAERLYNGGLAKRVDIEEAIKYLSKYLKLSIDSSIFMDGEFKIKIFEDGTYSIELKPKYVRVTKKIERLKKIHPYFIESRRDQITDAMRHLVEMYMALGYPIEEAVKKLDYIGVVANVPTITGVMKNEIWIRALIFIVSMTLITYPLYFLKKSDLLSYLVYLTKKLHLPFELTKIPFLSANADKIIVAVAIVIFLILSYKELLEEGVSGDKIMFIMIPALTGLCYPFYQFWRLIFAVVNHFAKQELISRKFQIMLSSILGILVSIPYYLMMSKIYK